MLKAVKVQKFNAKMCNDAIKFTTSSLIKKVSNNDDSVENQDTNDANLIECQFQFDLSCAVTNIGIHLCGWLVDLHTRCYFWLNKMPHDNDTGANSISHGINDYFGIVPTLFQTTHAVLFAHEEKSLSPQNMGALQHLSCHRIQQLHSLIFQEEQVEVLTDANRKLESSKKRSSDMIHEVKHLVNFIIYAACHRYFESDDVQLNESSNRLQFNAASLAAEWKLIAQNITTWISYSTLEHIKLF